MILRWEPVIRPAGHGKPACTDQYAIRSTDGRYTVCKIVCDGRVFFEAWRAPPARSAVGAVCLGLVDSAPEAKALAETDCSGQAATASR